MNQHINIEDYLEPTDPPLPLPAIETFKGTNTLDSTVEVGETMITQGYRIPLQIKQGATTKTADIYIGSSPLTQGQTITKSQSNVDLELFSGDNIIDTTLVNKPDASITYNSSVLGVGERTITSFTDWESGTTTTGVAQVGKTYAECKSNTSLTTRRRSVSIIPVVSGAATLHITSGYQAADIHLDKDGLYVGNAVYYHSNNYQITISDTVKYVALVLRKSDNSEFTDADVWDVYFTYSGANAYQIPLLVTSGQQSTPHTIYIGDSPLTAGQSVTKASSGTDIALYQGNNTISTSLGNKPEMKIDYLSTEVGVGERTKNYVTWDNVDDTQYNVHCYGENGYLRLVGTYQSDTVHQPFRMFFQLPAGSYVLSGAPDYDELPIRLAMCTYVGSASSYTTIGYDQGNGLSFTLTEDSDCFIGVRLQSGVIGVPIDLTLPCMVRPADTTSEFEPYGYKIPMKVKERTKNLFPISMFADINMNNVVMTADVVAGTVSVYTTSAPSETTQSGCDFTVSETGNYLLSGIPTSTPNDSLYMYCWDYNNNRRARAWDKTSTSQLVTKSNTESEIYLEAGVLYRVDIRAQAAYGAQITPVIVSPMVRKSDTSSDFEPYYSNATQTDIYIGSQPLLSGASINRSGTAIDIELNDGMNQITTDLYNEPEMYIK